MSEFSGIGDRIYGDVALWPRHGHTRQACRTGVTLAASVPGWAATLFTYGRHPRRRNEAAPASRPNAPKSARDNCGVLRAAAPQSATGGLADAVTAHETNILSYS